MALDRRTLRALLARPLIDEAASRATILIVAAGDGARRALHGISVSVRGAERDAPDHVTIHLGPRVLALPWLPDLRTEVHLVAVGADEHEHPVTQQLAARAQGLIIAADWPRVLSGLVQVRAGDDPVGAYVSLLARVFERVQKEHGDAGGRGPASEEAEPTPPSIGTRRCELSLLGVPGLTAQELLTALDQVMDRTRYRRCVHAGGGRDFVLLRGQAGAGLRVSDDRSGSAVDLAVLLAATLGQPLLVATVVAEQEIDPATGHTQTELSWTLESVNTAGIGAAYRDATRLSEPTPELPLDERACLYVAREVFSIQPARDGIAIHYERV